MNSAWYRADANTMTSVPPYNIGRASRLMSHHPRTCAPATTPLVGTSAANHSGEPAARGRSSGAEPGARRARPIPRGRDADRSAMARTPVGRGVDADGTGQHGPRPSSEPPTRVAFALLSLALMPFPVVLRGWGDPKLSYDYVTIVFPVDVALAGLLATGTARTVERLRLGVMGVGARLWGLLAVV